MRRTSARKAGKPDGAGIAASRHQRTMGRLSGALTSRAASAAAVPTVNVNDDDIVSGGARRLGEYFATS